MRKIHELNKTMAVKMAELADIPLRVFNLAQLSAKPAIEIIFVADWCGLLVQEPRCK